MGVKITYTVCTGKGAQSRVTHPFAQRTFRHWSRVTGPFVQFVPLSHTVYIVKNNPYIVIFRRFAPRLRTSLTLSQPLHSLAHYSPCVTPRCLAHFFPWAESCS